MLFLSLGELTVTAMKKKSLPKKTPKEAACQSPYGSVLLIANWRRAPLNGERNCRCGSTYINGRVIVKSCDGKPVCGDRKKKSGVTARASQL